MKPMKRIFTTALAIACWGLAGPTTTSAYDLNGSWASDAGLCDKIFTRQGGKVAFRPNADVYGSGFVVDGDRIRGRTANCRIKAQKEVGDLIHLLAACSTDIMLSSVQFTLKVKDANAIVRQLPGMSEMEMPYARCPAK
jgi:hypothetical protein